MYKIMLLLMLTGCGWENTPYTNPNAPYRTTINYESGLKNYTAQPMMLYPHHPPEPVSSDADQKRVILNDRLNQLRMWNDIQAERQRQIREAEKYCASISNGNDQYYATCVDAAKPWGLYQ